MDIQARKIEFVQAFLKIEQEYFISQFEKLLQEQQSVIKPMNIADFNKRIDKSLLDSKNDRVIENTVLLNKVRQWN